MRTVVEPKIHIDRLWSTPYGKDGDTFRMMRYVIRIDYENHMFLHNVVTGQLVMLDQNEAKVIETLPTSFSPLMKELIDSYYLVATDFNEHKTVVGIRETLRKLEDNEKKQGITYYTILPTTVCNARCYYCYEHGIKPVTMTEHTANAVVRFIKSSCKGQAVRLSWFGGEPTVAINRIDQICEGLNQEQVVFSSKITTNGYLLDEETIKKAKRLWNLRHAMICVDGIEEHYNTTKAYVGASDNPYHRVMRNIGLLLDQGIQIALRMNFDLHNYQDFAYLLEEAGTRYKNNPLLDVYVHQIVGDFSSIDQSLIHGNEEWFQLKIYELNNLSHKRGLHRQKDTLPCLKYYWCLAASDHCVTITPQGDLVSCPEQLNSGQIKGNVENGLLDYQLVQSWKRFGEYDRCYKCTLFPDCVKIANCNGKNCYSKQEKMHHYEEVIRKYAAQMIQ